MLLSFQNVPIKEAVKRLKESNEDLKQPFLLVTTANGTMEEEQSQKLLVLDHTPVLLPCDTTFLCAFFHLYCSFHTFHVQYSKNGQFAFQTCDMVVKPRDVCKTPNCVNAFFAAFKKRTSVSD